MGRLVHNLIISLLVVILCIQFIQLFWKPKRQESYAPTSLAGTSWTGKFQYQALSTKYSFANAVLSFEPTGQVLVVYADKNATGQSTAIAVSAEGTDTVAYYGNTYYKFTPTSAGTLQVYTKTSATRPYQLYSTLQKYPTYFCPYC